MPSGNNYGVVDKSRDFGDGVNSTEYAIQKIHGKYSDLNTTHYSVTIPFLKKTVDIYVVKGVGNEKDDLITTLLTYQTILDLIFNNKP